MVEWAVGKRAWTAAHIVGKMILPGAVGLRVVFPKCR